jgi:hypothetical protein
VPALILGNHRGLPLRLICPMSSFRTMFMGTYLVGAGPCACPDFGQPQGVAPTIDLPDVLIPNHVHGNVSRRGRPPCLPMILGNHRGLPLRLICPMSSFRTMFMGTYLVGAGPRACPDFGQPQGVAPTIDLPDVLIPNHVHGNVSRRGRPPVPALIFLGNHRGLPLRLS